MAKRMLEIEGVCEIEVRKWGGGGSEVCVSQRGRIFVVTKINERVWPC